MDQTQVSEVSKQIADLGTAANIVSTLVCGFLVMFMQAGFALVETGLCRRKNVAQERETRALERERLDRAWGQGSYYDNRAPEPSLVHHGFVTAGDIALLGRMHRLGQPEPYDLQLAKKAPLLVIDDVSAPHARTEATWALLEARNNSALPSIVTSGDTSARFYERFGNAAVRRMLQIRGEKGVLIDCDEGARK